MEGRRDSPTPGFQGRTEKEGSAGNSSCTSLLGRPAGCPLAQRARGLRRCRERTPFGWGRAPRVSGEACPSPTVFSPLGPSVQPTSVFPLRPSAAPDLPNFSWRDEAGPAQMHTPPLSSFSSLFCLLGTQDKPERDLQVLVVDEMGFGPLSVPLMLSF